MSDHAHRIMLRQLKADDNMIQADEHHLRQQVLAEDAYQKEQAMRESHPSCWLQDDGDLLAYYSEDVI